MSPVMKADTEKHPHRQGHPRQPVPVRREEHHRRGVDHSRVAAHSRVVAHKNTTVTSRERPAPMRIRLMAEMTGLMIFRSDSTNNHRTRVGT